MSEMESKLAFSAKEVEYMAAGLMSLKDGLPTVSTLPSFSQYHPAPVPNLTSTQQAANLDIPKFAKIAGLTEGSSRTIWGRLRTKILAQPGAASDVDGLPATPKLGGKAKPKATPGSKRKVGEDGDVTETPSKKPRAKKAKAKAKEVEVVDEDEEIKDEQVKDEEVKDEEIKDEEAP